MPPRKSSVTEAPSFQPEDGLDPVVADIEEIDGLEAEGSHQGIGRRADKPPSDREHGLKTRARNKEINSGRPFGG